MPHYSGARNSWQPAQYKTPPGTGSPARRGAGHHRGDGPLLRGGVFDRAGSAYFAAERRLPLAPYTKSVAGMAPGGRGFGDLDFAARRRFVRGCLIGTSSIQEHERQQQ
jgi:hypothetical protein